MRHYVLMIFLIAGLKAGRAQNPFEPDTNIACVERLEMPLYPPLAIQAHVEGTVTASVLLSPQGSAQLITTEFDSRTRKVYGALIHVVEDAIREGAYRPNCAGRTVVLIFDFKIAGRPADGPRSRLRSATRTSSGL